MSHEPIWKISTTEREIFPPFAHTLSKALEPFSRKLLYQLPTLHLFFPPQIFFLIYWYPFATPSDNPVAQLLPPRD